MTSFEQVARRTKARFVVGLSATVERKNGHHPIIFMQCGPVRHRVNAKAQAVARPFEHRVFVQPTAFKSGSGAEPDARVEFQALYRELVDDDLRNRRICDDVAECVQSGRSPLVLTEGRGAVCLSWLRVAIRLRQIVRRESCATR